MPGISLGGFSFDVEVGNSKALASLVAIERAATQVNVALMKLNGGNVGLNAGPATASLAQLGAVSKAAQAAASFTATPKINIAPAQSEMAKFAASVGQGLGFGGGAAIAVSAIHAVTGAITDGIGAGVAYNARIESAQKTFELFTGSVGRASGAMAILKTYANTTMFDTAEVVEAGKIFINVADGNVAAMEKMIHLAGQLAATNPDVARGGGFEGATTSIRELMAGQVESIATRFNVSRSALAEAKAQGQTGLELVQTAIKLAHGSEELVQTQGKTFVGQMSNFRSAVTEAQGLVTTGFTASISAELPKATAAVERHANDWRMLGAVLGGIPALAFAALDALEVGDRPVVGGRGAPTLSPAFLARLEAAQRAVTGGNAPPAGTSIQARSRGSGADLQRLLEQAPPQVDTAAAQAGTLTPEQRAAAAAHLRELASATAAARQVELQGIQTLFSAEASAVKDNQAAQVTAINATRDSAVSAFGARRDAALAGLDAEQTARSRARTLEDRAIASSNEAILAGLETTHNAQLKGLDDQLTAIQKRGDAALKGLDDEKTAEDARHDAALTNIIAERDAKLGVVDAGLAALSAENTAHAQGREDTAERKALAEAQRDLKDAKTPAERTAARNAIARAQDAINETAYQRGVAARRAVFEGQRDTINADAKTATTAEGVTHEGEDNRISDLRERVKTETAIEAKSITDRVTAENAAYQQTVKDQQKAFSDQASALADQRYGEDQAVAARRTAISTAYENDTSNAKTSADAQIADQERITKAAVLEIEKRRKAAENAAKLPVTIAPVISGAGATPPTSSGTSGDPAGGSEFGPFDPPGYRDAGAGVGGAVAAGLAAGLQSEAAQAAVKGGTDQLVQTNVIDEAATLLEAKSPSQVFFRLGADTAQGFVDGYKSVDLAAAGREPLEALRDWITPYYISTMTTGGANAAAAYRDAYGAVPGSEEGAGAGLYAIGIAPFEKTIEWMKGMPDQFKSAGDGAGGGFKTGFDGAHVGDHLYGEVRGALFDMANLYPSFVMLGANFATSLANGFDNRLAQWHAMQGGGSSGSSSSGDSGDDSDLDLGDYVGYARGGMPKAGRVALFGEHGPELGVPVQAGQVLPADVSRNLLAAAAGRAPDGAAGGGGNTFGDINISIDGAGQNADAILDQVGTRVIDAVAQALEQARTTTSTRVSRLLPGAD